MQPGVNSQIDQTASEVQLHRVLWIIKFLRAMVLHVFLALIAILLFFWAGIDGVYPLAIDMIHAIRAQTIQNQIEGSVIGVWGHVIASSVLFALALVLLIWVYRSITQVRRIALRAQAILLVLLYLMNIDTKWQEVKFAYENLSALFAVLAALGILVTLVMFPLIVAMALWRVSRSKERSSLVATLDPRLAPNVWIYLNKLLDLPRTPLRTWSSACAYLLALGGTVLLIASMMYLITVGGTSNKLAALAIACGNHRDLMADCVALSSAWARDIPLWLLLALAGVKLAALLQSAAKRLGGLSVSDVLKKPDDPFVLYLRPFDVDDVTLPRPRLPLLSRLLSFRPFPIRIEEELFDVADGYRPLIAVGKPGSSSTARGGLAYRTYLDDTEWQGYVADRIQRADRIVLLIKDTPGVRWELERVISEGAISKTLFLFDPAMRRSNDWKTIEKMVVPLLQSSGKAPQSFDLSSRPIGFFFQDGTFVTIVNANWTATSYRTAFSYFLAEPVG